MDIYKASEQYEAWLATQTKIVEADLVFKHKQMKQGPFPFLRATFYRWAQIWSEVCSDLTTAPTVLAVGDLHVENFGTWRDIEGRLIWGINDFDEAFLQPYLLDILRLIASAHVATETEHLRVSPKRATELIWDGYVHNLNKGGGPFV